MRAEHMRQRATMKQLALGKREAKPIIIVLRRRADNVLHAALL